jgi:hypothetical protein
VVERALNEKYDFMKDYTLLQDEDGWERCLDSCYLDKD